MITAMMHRTASIVRPPTEIPIHASPRPDSLLWRICSKDVNPSVSAVIAKSRLME